MQGGMRVYITDRDTSPPGIFQEFMSLQHVN